MCVMAEYSLVQHLINVQLCSQYLNVSDTSELARLCDRNQTETVREHIAPQQLQAMVYYNLLLFVFPLLTATMGASWSDTFGRRLTMLIPIVGSFVVQFILYASSRSLGTSNILISIWCCAALSGLTGTSGLVIVSCHGYVCERVRPSRLTRRMTWLEASLFVGGFLGFNLIGRMLQTLPLQQQFLCGFGTLAALHLLNIAYIGLAVSEVDRLTSRQSIHDLFKLDHVKQVWITVTRRRANNVGPRTFAAIYFCSFLSSCALTVQTFLMFVYVRDAPFNWTAADYSYYSAIGFLVNGISLVLLFPVFYRFVRWLVHCCSVAEPGYHDQQESTVESSGDQLASIAWSQTRILIQIDLLLCIFGLFSKFAGLVLLGLATNVTMLFVVLAVLVLNEFAMPSFRSIIGKLVDKEEKGKALSIISMLQNASFFFGSIGFNFIFQQTHQIHRGLTFETVAAMQLLGIVVLM